MHRMDDAMLAFQAGWVGGMIGAEKSPPEDFGDDSPERNAWLDGYEQGRRRREENDAGELRQRARGEES